MPKHRWPFYTVLYWNDLETDALWEDSRRILLDSGVDGVDFYYVREHELRHQGLDVLLPRIRRCAALSAALRAAGLDTRAALLPALGWGQDPAFAEGLFDKVVGPDGVASGVGACALASRLQEYLLTLTRELAGGGFSAVLLEDDFQNDNHRPVRHGCFCPLHMEAFSERDARTWTRDRLSEALATDVALRERWDAFRMGVLANLAQRLREAARAVKPDIAMLLWAGADVAANPKPVLKALDARTWRPGQGHYSEGEHRFIPVAGPWRGWIAHAEAGRTRDLAAIAEITGWPRNAYAKSWSTVRLQTAVSGFLGFDSALFWTGFGGRDSGFASAMRLCRGWYERLRAEVLAHPDALGLRALVPGSASALPAGALALARMGIPVVPALAGEIAPHTPFALLGPVASEADIEALSPAILDAEAIRSAPRCAVRCGMALQPAPCFFSSERHRDLALNGPTAGYFSTALTLLRREDMQALQPLRPMEALADFLDNDSLPATPSMLLDESEKRLFLNYGAAAWDRLISPAKAEQLRRTLGEVAAPPPMLFAGGPDIFLFVRAGRNSRLALLVNLSLDAAEEWRLHSDTPVLSAAVASDRGEWLPLAEGECPVRGRPAALPARSAALLRFGVGG